MWQGKVVALPRLPKESLIINKCIWVDILGSGEKLYVPLGRLLQISMIGEWGVVKPMLLEIMLIGARNMYSLVHY